MRAAHDFRTALDRRPGGALRLLIAVLLLTVWALANDRSIEGTGGTLRVSKGEHTSVRMVRESIAMEVWPRIVVTTVDFEFKNEGPATKVLLGFPEQASGDVNFEELRNRSGFLTFESWADGQPLKAQRKIVALDPDRESFEAHWVREVSFAANQTRKVRVRYRSRAGTIAGGDHYVLYEFTGGGWKGKVAESKVAVHFHVPFELQEGSSRVDRTADGVACTFRDWEADGTNLSVHYHRLDPGYVCPGTDGRPVTEQELKGLSADQLMLARNEVFARYGRPFKDPELRAYFQGKSWYHEDPAYTDAWLDPWDRANAELIMKHEH